VSDAPALQPLDPSRALVGPIAISVGLRPDPPHELVYFMAVYDESYEEPIGLVLGGTEDLTEFQGTLVRTKNMGDRAEALMAERHATTVEERMAVLAEVAKEFAVPDDPNTEQRGI